MQRTLKSVLVRGVFGVALSAAAMVGAGAKVMTLHGSVRLVDGRIQIDSSRDSAALCAAMPDGGSVSVMAAERAES